jgi:ATP-binding protein involved in chromosome partitioning
MSEFNEKQIEALLGKIKYPGFSRDIISFGIVRKVLFTDSRLTIGLEFSTDDTSISEKVISDIGTVLGEAGVQDADIQVSHKNPQAEKEAAKENLLPSVKHVIAVASGKGGVGKSTIAANLAISMAKNGLRIGLLDADIYGPSVQMLLGLDEQPKGVDGKNRIYPLEAFGIKAMSMGVLVDMDTALVWRGPMVSSAVEQLLKDVEWGELDVLVLDMPPGTGDIQLTISQKVKLAGAVIITTPQEMALIDARKGIAMFQKVEIPVLGLIENMSYFVAPDTGKRYEIFSNGGARREALRQRVPFLGEVPLQPEIREGSDAGKPVAATDSPAAEVFSKLAESVWNAVKVQEENK